MGAIALREAVEGIVPPHAARRAIAEALATSGTPFPDTLAELVAFVRGPLARQLRLAQLDDEAAEIAARIDRLGARVEAPRQAAPPAPPDDDEPTARIHRVSLRPVAQSQRERVRVVVLAAGTAFADALAACPQADGLAILRITSESALAGALHAGGPLVVVIDAASDIDEDSLRAALSDRACQPSVLVTAADGLRGRRLLHALTRAGIAAVGVAEGRSAASIAEILVRKRA